ncbi:hypothetical protein GCM10017620_10080 [Brevundimonas intermedia]|uniref:Cation/multidrug efflux pump n=1 Tax=Brevundimonas intermedia TaxID=74315 RepID=A0ABQ5T7H6_9CAUL|nr:hypothetical protein [Brevundimonas intermedia]GLK48035.1 hypothetical protein GCM10017620_10080 [Brevundimonas intermedia]
MIWWWWVLPAAVALIGFVVLIRGLRALSGGKPFRGVAGALFGGGALWAASLAALFGMNLQTYERLTYERPVATLALRQLGPQYYEINLTQPTVQGQTADAGALYPVHGDDWRIEAQVLKWKPWANVMGLDSQYRLDRLSGRYRAIEQELHGERSAYDLAAASNARNGAVPFKVEAWDAIRRYRPYVDAADTLYGSAAYMPMADGARYEVWITQSGLVARPVNDVARNASAGGWTVAN